VWHTCIAVAATLAYSEGGRAPVMTVVRHNVHRLSVRHQLIVHPHQKILATPMPLDPTGDQPQNAVIGWCSCVCHRLKPPQSNFSSYRYVTGHRKLDGHCTVSLFCLAAFFLPYLAEKSGCLRLYFQDMPTLWVEGHARQISHADSQDGNVCCQYCYRDTLNTHIHGNSYQSWIKEGTGECSVSAQEMNLRIYLQ